LQQGKIFYRELSSEVCTSQKDTVFVQKLGLKVIIITESVNVSAALDFIDELKIMTKNVILIGQKTKADRLYMEVRSVNLPSETGQFIFPIKVYRNRMRGDNKPYIHNIEFADIHNTAFLQSIILKKIKSKKL
jgi:predicted mannosyl-3-phosphoglycerate phosphatase (HAD superfamily)